MFSVSSYDGHIKIFDVSYFVLVLTTSLAAIQAGSGQLESGESR